MSEAPHIHHERKSAFNGESVTTGREEREWAWTLAVAITVVIILAGLVIGYLKPGPIIPTCKIIDRHCERSEAIQSPCRGLWIASSAEPAIGLAEGETRWPPRNDESMILQVGITGAILPIGVTLWWLLYKLANRLDQQA